MPPHGGKNKNGGGQHRAPPDANSDIAPWETDWWQEAQYGDCHCDKMNNVVKSDAVCRQKKLDNFRVLIVYCYT